MRLRSVDIHEQTFDVSFRGFDPGEVDDFLEKVAEEIELLNQEKEELTKALAEEKETRLRIEEALAASHDMQKTIIDHARKEAHQILGEARAEAQRYLDSTRNRAVDFLRDLETLREKRITFLSELAGMAEMMREWVDRQPAEPGADVSHLESTLGERETFDPTEELPFHDLTEEHEITDLPEASAPEENDIAMSPVEEFSGEEEAPEEEAPEEEAPEEEETEGSEPEEAEEEPNPSRKSVFTLSD